MLISWLTSVDHLPVKVQLVFIVLQASMAGKKQSVSVEEQRKIQREYQRKRTKELNSDPVENERQRWKVKKK